MERYRNKDQTMDRGHALAGVHGIGTFLFHGQLVRNENLWQKWLPGWVPKQFHVYSIRES